MSVLFEEHGHVVVITINRPKVMNAIDPDTNAELAQLWKRFGESDPLRVAILTGAGEKAFSAGADLRTLIPAYRDAVRRGERQDWNFGGNTRGFATTKPIIAAINGHCLAGGLEMALACDIRICSTNATFGLAEVRHGIIPGAGGTQRLPRMVPASIAMQIILTGDPIDAPEALRIGLVNRVLPQRELIPAAMTLAEAIASRGPLAVRAAKRAIVEGMDRGFDHGMELEQRLFDDLMRTEDAAEGATAYAERREPVYHGR